MEFVWSSYFMFILNGLYPLIIGSVNSNRFLDHTYRAVVSHAVRHISIFSKEYVYDERTGIL